MDPTLPFGMLGGPTSGRPFGWPPSFPWSSGARVASPGASPVVTPPAPPVAGWQSNYMGADAAPLNPADPSAPSAPPGILNGATPPAATGNPLAGQQAAGNNLAQLGMNMMKGPPAPPPLKPIEMARPMGMGQGFDPSRLIAAMRGLPLQ